MDKQEVIRKILVNGASWKLFSFSAGRDLGWGLQLMLKCILGIYVYGKLNLIEFGHILYNEEL